MAKAFKHTDEYLQREVAKSFKNKIVITVTEQANYLSNKVQTGYLSAKWL